jgi:hypothetical protein
VNADMPHALKPSLLALGLAPALALVLLAGSPALAAAPANPPPAAAVIQPPAPSPEAMKAAMELSDLLGVPNQARGLMANFRAQMVGAMMRAGAKDQAEAVSIVDQMLMPGFVAHEQELTELLVRPYAANFALSDLKELTAFYRSPLGQRLINAMPAVTRDGLQAGQKLGAKLFKEELDKHKDALKQRGLKF